MQKKMMSFRKKHDPGVLLKDSVVFLKEPGVLLKGPGVLLKDPGVLTNHHDWPTRLPDERMSTTSVLSLLSGGAPHRDKRQAKPHPRFVSHCT